MRLQVGGLDHEPIGFTNFGGELGEDAVEHALAAPPDSGLDRLVRTIRGRRITPAQPIPDHENNAAHDPPVIDPRNAMRQWEIGLDPAHLRFAQKPQLGQQQHLLDAAIESTDRVQRKRVNGS